MVKNIKKLNKKLANFGIKLEVDTFDSYYTFDKNDLPMLAKKNEIAINLWWKWDKHISKHIVKILSIKVTDTNKLLETLEKIEEE